MYTHKTELFETTVDVANMAHTTAVDDIATVQDVMLNLRIDWEELQSRLRSRKVDGFESIIAAIKRLAATALVMSAALQAKALTQREQQLAYGKEDESKEIRLHTKSKSDKCSAKISRKLLKAN